MVVLVAVVAVVVVVEAAAVVEAVRGVKLAFGTRTFNSFYAKHVLWRRWWWRCEEGARRPGLEGQVLRHVLWHVLRSALRRVLHVLVLHVSPKGRRGGGSRLDRRAPQHNYFLPLERLRSLRPFHARPSRVDHHFHWACCANKGRRTFKERATIKKPLIYKTRGAWGGGSWGQATSVNTWRRR